ncbi:hypothetical protein OOZ54_13865 [Rhodopseudomonas palustris]|uniref:hypothetical protein n=1 Tax=Rhodopseudomonas palustris TaxID=1076 RepID=UPI0022F131E4|nr:hypothetical protein [Rhodopseudomonas palustris]WBU27751.1 hypothetical protein OOZ54_13865 [Rhodopseudomonas palustris]
MTQFDVSASTAYRSLRLFVEANTREEALRSFVEYYSNNSLDGLDYAKPLWVIENGGNNGIVGIFNGDTEDDARAAYARDAGFQSLGSFIEWEHELDRELQRDRRIADEEIEEKEDDEVATIDLALVEACEA